MFSDEVVIVTGAAGNLGAAVVEILTSRGARVAAMDRTEASLDAVLAKVAEPERHLAVAGVDLTETTACAALVEQVLQRFGRVDGLVNTVGTFAMAGIDEADPAQWEFLFKVNLSTTLNMCRAAVPPMRGAGRGSIVNVGAGAALKAPAGMSAYAASKSAVLRLTESLAAELKSRWRARQQRPAQHDRHAAESGRDAQGRCRQMGDAGAGRRGGGVPARRRRQRRQWRRDSGLGPWLRPCARSG